MAEAKSVTIQVSDDGTHLVTGDNQTIYLFYPMRIDPAHRFIPWGRDFPGYMLDWILQWLPLTGSPVAGRGVNQSDLSSFVRGGGPDKDAVQAVYRGWWLYIRSSEAPGQQNPVPGLFQLVPAKPELLELIVRPENVMNGSTYGGGP